MKKILWLGIAALGAYEFSALKTKKAGDTISERVWYWCHRPLVPFALGMLCGHFVWQAQEVYDDVVKVRLEQINTLSKQVIEIFLYKKAY